MLPPRLDKALGQHHLVSGSLCRPLIEFLQPGGQRVVEVGPGGGVLTAELLAAGARVLAWEVDLAWAAELRRRWQRQEAAGTGGPRAIRVRGALGLRLGRPPPP